MIDGKYEVRGLLGEGGMSAVYEAMHLGLDRLVALKLLRSGVAVEPGAKGRLQHEAEVVSVLHHPNICEIFDLGTTAEGMPYLVMERLVGETLSERIVRDAPLAFLDVSGILKQMLGALDFAHEKGVLHRDLKPENVFLERRRGVLSVKLLDFGISKWMQDFSDSVADGPPTADAIACTPYYMSPEQARGDSAIDQRVDLWAVGVMAYEALTGRRPFVARNYNALLVSILTSQPRPVDLVQPELHPAVSEFVQRALAKPREDRFQSALEMRRAVNEVQEICLAEDSYAPTMVMRRRKRAPTPAPSRGAFRWTGRIEDPDTCIDDDIGRTHQQRLVQPLPPGGLEMPRAGGPATPTAAGPRGPLGAGREVNPRVADLKPVLFNTYGGSEGVMRLPPPPRVESPVPRAPASFARLHRLDDLFPNGRPPATLDSLQGSNATPGVAGTTGAITDQPETAARTAPEGQARSTAAMWTDDPKTEVMAHREATAPADPSAPPPKGGSNR